MHKEGENGRDRERYKYRKKVGGKVKMNRKTNKERK
jgi:hypothetical protein